MCMLRAAFAAALVWVGAFAPAQAADTLSLDDAYRRVVESHPDLAALQHAESALLAEAEHAAFPPPLQLAGSAENALGTGSAAGLRGVELSLSLASVLERGDKRAARQSLAERRLDGLALQREARRLDLLAEVARRYLDALAACAISRMLLDELNQRERLVDAARQRVRAGGSAEAVALAAESARLRVAAELAQSERREQLARRRLAMLWGEVDADFALASVDLLVLPAVPELDRLLRGLANTPELQRFAHESRLREARLQLARSSGIADLDWQVGVRRLQAEDDWGLIGSVSIPLGSAQRAEPAIRAAEAELAAVDFARAGEQRVLQATLAEAWGQLDLSVARALQIDQRLLPALQRAADAAEQAFRAGAVGHLDWAQLQSELTLARRERLEASLAAHRALIELQRLTGETLQVAADTDTKATP